MTHWSRATQGSPLHFTHHMKFDEVIGVKLSDLTVSPLRATQGRRRAKDLAPWAARSFAALRMTGRSFQPRMGLSNSTICERKYASLCKLAYLRVYLHSCPPYDIYTAGSGVGELYWCPTI